MWSVSFCCIACGLLMTETTGLNLELDLIERFERVYREIATACLHPYPASCPKFSKDVLSHRTRAFLFTRKNPQLPEFLHDCGGRLPLRSHFNPRDRTEVFIHGWLDGVCVTHWMREIKDELLKRGSYNVILVDWTWGNQLAYYNSSIKTMVAGEHVGGLIQNIMEQTGVGPENFHLVGHSLGGHVAGFVGKTVHNLRRVTGLDPSILPLPNITAFQRLNQTDATLVDVIHTNGGEIGDAIGDPYPLGDADFYPNGGEEQRPCYPDVIRSYLELDLLYAIATSLPEVCYHARSVQFYKASINPKCLFVGHQCDSYASYQAGDCPKDCLESDCAVMGMDFEYIDHPVYVAEKNRSYYLDTPGYYPYCDEEIR